MPQPTPIRVWFHLRTIHPPRNGIFTNNGGAADGNDGGGTFFNDDTTAANGTFINNAGAVSGANGGLTFFFGNATAAGGIFTNNVAVGASSGVTSFFNPQMRATASFLITVVPRPSLSAATPLFPTPRMPAPESLPMRAEQRRVRSEPTRPLMTIRRR